MKTYHVSDAQAEWTITAETRGEALAEIAESFRERGGRTWLWEGWIRDGEGDGERASVVVHPLPPCGGSWEAGPAWGTGGGVAHKETCDCGRRHTRTRSTWYQDPATGQVIGEGWVYPADPDDCDYDYDDDYVDDGW